MRTQGAERTVGGPDGFDEGQAGRGERDDGARLDAALAPGGYGWWYLDVVSDDGELSLTVIAMLGSPFSPWYAAARREGPTDPLAFSTFHAALEGRRGSRFALTERGRRAVARDATSLAIGTSSLAVEPGRVIARIDERTAPWGEPLRGRVVLHHEGGAPTPLAIDGEGRHRWWPLAPVARAEVLLDEPSVRFAGHAYHDANIGDEPLEAAFRAWTWSRVTGDIATVVAWDVEPRVGAPRHAALTFGRHGATGDAPELVAVPLPRTGFGLQRTARARRPADARVLRTLHDGPFYARSLVEVAVAQGGRAVGTHERLDLDRFISPWVQRLLPYRMRLAR